MQMQVLVLACLALAGNARRVQTSWQPSQAFVGTPGHVGTTDHAPPTLRASAASMATYRPKPPLDDEYKLGGIPGTGMPPPPLAWNMPAGYPKPKKDEGRYMYGEPYAPRGQGYEYINAPNVRKPLEEFVGASEELQLGKYFKGEPLEVWDPLSFHKLSKVSANNPDIAWLREAELKHGRIAMLAFVGICTTAAGNHWPAQSFADACSSGWPNALGKILSTNPGIFFQALLTIALVEGVSNAERGKGKPQNWFDALWFGEREGNDIYAGDLGFDPLGLLSKDKKAADLMRLKELKNGRLAMLAVMDLFFRYLNTGKAFPEV